MKENTGKLRNRETDEKESKRKNLGKFFPTTKHKFPDSKTLGPA